MGSTVSGSAYDEGGAVGSAVEGAVVRHGAAGRAVQAGFRCLWTSPAERYICVWPAQLHLHSLHSLSAS